MTDKTWTATALEQGALKITPQSGGVLHVERRYVFLDADGKALAQIAGGRVTADVEWENIPEEVQDALLAIDAWTMQQALVQEEMD